VPGVCPPGHAGPMGPGRPPLLPGEVEHQTNNIFVIVTTR
jgi:hypothetical protein